MNTPENTRKNPIDAGAYGIYAQSLATSVKWLVATRGKPVIFSGDPETGPHPATIDEVYAAVKSRIKTQRLPDGGGVRLWDKESPQHPTDLLFYKTFDPLKDNIVFHHGMFDGSPFAGIELWIPETYKKRFNILAVNAMIGMRENIEMLKTTSGQMTMLARSMAAMEMVKEQTGREFFTIGYSLGGIAAILQTALTQTDLKPALCFPIAALPNPPAIFFNPTFRRMTHNSLERQTQTAYSAGYDCVDARVEAAAASFRPVVVLDDLRIDGQKQYWRSSTALEIGRGGHFNGPFVYRQKIKDFIEEEIGKKQNIRN